MDVDPEVARLLDQLVDAQRRALGARLVGTSVFGSVVTGAFEPGVSDVDTVAVMDADPDDHDLRALGRLHRTIAETSPPWDDRVEATYLSREALRDFRSRHSPAARIAPGEAFHRIELDPSYVLDWYRLRTEGVAVIGPTPSRLVPPISRREYVIAVRSHLLDRSWLDVSSARGDQAYVVLTMCRGLRTLATGEDASKSDAADWARRAIPEHAELIAEALAWRRTSRRGPLADGVDSIDAVRRFVRHVYSAVRDMPG